RLDGRPLASAAVPATLTGPHAVEIVMNGRWPAGRVNQVENHFAPETPVTRLAGDTLSWDAVPGAARYTVHRNGAALRTVTETRTLVTRDGRMAEYQVAAVDAAGARSFLSEPVRLLPPDAVLIARPMRGVDTGQASAAAARPLTLSREENRDVRLAVRVPCAATYEIQARYANGSGPINTDSKAAVRTLAVDGRAAGVLVMPQRGTGAWSDWGYSTVVRSALAAGPHTLSLTFAPLDENMDGKVNTAILDHVRLTRITGCR
ncbi:MAG TPA: hypothetical protein VFH27_17040, partial [Longimicrobiaceae bacterium]|nr:hypothetical protein [Longimicrobiaceae bacterium]